MNCPEIECLKKLFDDFYMGIIICKKNKIILDLNKFAVNILKIKKEKIFQEQE